MEEFLKSVLFSRIVESAIAVIVAIVIYRIYKKIVNAGRKNKVLENKVDNKKITYIRLVSSIIKYCLIIATILVVMKINGVNVDSLLAGVGIISIIVGLALQDALKDIIMGSNIITDSFFSVGDVVRYKDIEGKVLVLGLKTTKIQDINTKDIVAICNRNINEIVNVSDVLDIKIPISYDEKIEKIESVLQLVSSQIREIKKVKDCQYKGIVKFDDSSILYNITIYCEPEYKPGIKVKAHHIIKLMLDKNDIEMPYMQVDIHSR